MRLTKYDCCNCSHYRVCYKICMYHVGQENTGLYCPSFVEAKSDVAREIFKEIEKEIKQSLVEHNNKKLQYNIDDALFHLYHGITASQMGMLDFIAELKKKYTGGENDGSQNIP